MKRSGNEGLQSSSEEPTPLQRWAAILESCYVRCNGVKCAEYGACMDPEDEMCAAKREGETPLRWTTSS